MTRFGRRTFLASSAGVAAGAALVETCRPVRPGRRVSRTPAESSCAPRRRQRRRDAATGSLTVNGLVDPVGVDPDDCSFAWTLQATGRAAAQTGYRIRVRRTDPGQAGTCGTAGLCRGAAGLRRLRRAAAGGRRLVRMDRAGARTPPPWGRCPPRPLPHGAAPGRLARRSGCARPRARSSRTASPTCARSSPHPPGGTVRATAYVSAAHTYRLFVDGQVVDQWPSFSYPGRAVRPGDRPDRPACTPAGQAALGVLHRWYGAGKGRPASAPGLLVQALAVVRRRAARRLTAPTTPGASSPPNGSPRRSATRMRATSSNGLTHGPSRPGGPIVGFNDSAWSSATVIGPVGSAPFTRTYAQRTTDRRACRDTVERPHTGVRLGRGRLRRGVPGPAPCHLHLG